MKVLRKLYRKLSHLIYGMKIEIFMSKQKLVAYQSKLFHYLAKKEYVSKI